MIMFNTDINIEKALDALTLKGRLSHAILINGGTCQLREAIALYLARFTVCDSQTDKPCEKCENCRKSRDNVHPDIYFLKKRSDRRFYRKQDVQAFCEGVYRTPNEANIKPLVLLELQDMNEECQNLLLRILEEPPSYTSFILTASSKNVVLDTVLSRVTKLDLGQERIEHKKESKCVDIARSIAKSILSPDEFDIIKASCELDKNKQLFEDVLFELVLIFRDALFKSYENGGQISYAHKEAADLSATLTKKQLMTLYDTASRLLEQTDLNKNKALMTASLTSQLRQAVEVF